MPEMSNALWEAIVARDRRAVARLGDPNTDTALRAEMDRRALVAEVRHLKRTIAQMPEVTLSQERGEPARCTVRIGGREVFRGSDDSTQVSDGRLPRALLFPTDPLVLREGDTPEQVNAANERIRRACEEPWA